MLTSSSICFAIFLTSWLYSKEPSAMDVYEGKTTLQITYKDSVAIDSVIVFK